MREIALSSDGDANGPNVAVRIFKDDVTPAVREIGCGLNDFCSGRFGARLQFVGIEAHDADLRASAARTRNFQARKERMMVVGVIGMEHEVGARKIQGDKIRIGVPNLGEENVAEKPDM